SQSVAIFKLVAPFGVINSISFGLLMVAIVILSTWTWYYLLKRLSTQLFILSMTGVVALSLIITGIFVTLLLKNVETESLTKLTSNARVASSLLEEKKLRLLSETKLFALDPQVVSAIADNDRKVLSPKVKAQMTQTDVSSLIVADSEGKIILQGENEEVRGVSLSDDKYVQKALGGETLSGFVASSQVIAPEISMKVAVPAGKGAIIVSYVLDNSFVDGIKTNTGLSVSIYGDKILSSTTLDIGDGKTRLSGIKETNKKVLENVWKKGEVYAAVSTLGDEEYLSAYIPLKDQNNEVVAVMQVSQAQIAALQTAGLAVQTTFGFIILIMTILALPLNLICKKLVKEWE
ncbi:MAG: cache domain-containing protein, partial [bacterium]